ncbi:hypothetical protein KUW19_00695 [Ferrimonas balearica]|uniref:DUF6943 family protein n=1 Tax=Ferrimonas balearica TaxID=44012 RepID=UPI001C955CD2|nr:hypothetical protein [Ferrimonas balearica]MBY6104994.1 hypothetical protein [Ferrimonas balearica]
MRIKVWNGEEVRGPCFFVLNKGNRAGFPRLEPWHPGNCWIVTGCDVPATMAKIRALQEAGIFRQRIHGSCQQFLRLSWFVELFERYDVPAVHLRKLAELEALAAAQAAAAAKTQAMISQFRRSVIRAV